MIKKFDDEDLKNRAEMYFFDPSKSRDNYEKEYINRYDESHIKKYKGIGFSPLYFLRRDISFCLGPYGYNKKINHKNSEPSALFAGLLLISIALETFERYLFERDKNAFPQKYMDIKGKDAPKRIENLYNTLKHLGYSLSYKDRDRSPKIYFPLSTEFPELIEKDTGWKRPYPSELYKINPKLLHKALEKGIDKLKQDIIDKKDGLHKRFIKNFRVKNWIKWRQKS